MTADEAFDIAYRLADEAQNAYIRGDVEEGDEKIREAKAITDRYFPLTDAITSDSIKTHT